MERLIKFSSNSIIPCKLQHNSPILPGLARVGLTRKLAQSSSSSCTASFPFLSGSVSRGVKASFISAKSLNNCADVMPNGSDPPNGCETEIHFVEQKLSQQKKVFNAGTVILLSAIFLTLFHHTFVPPALATFSSATTTGGRTLIRSQLLTSAWTGLIAGCLHTLSGPDHLAALAPLSIGCSRIESVAVGALWGCGHDAGQLIFGLIFLLLKDKLHIEIIRTWGTVVVGFTLLVIGAMGIKEASEVVEPCLALENNETISSPSKKIGFATFATGIVHGLQPDALLMVLPALALPSRLAGAAFLFMFLVGTVVAMGSYTAFIGSCSQALKERVPRITEKLTWASSLIAIAVGLGILFSQFFGLSLY